MSEGTCIDYLMQIAELEAKITRLTAENEFLKSDVTILKREAGRWRQMAEEKEAENAGLKEYSDSRDESIKVYREEVKELKERMKGVEEVYAFVKKTGYTELFDSELMSQGNQKEIWIHKLWQAIKKACEVEE